MIPINHELQVPDILLSAMPTDNQGAVKFFSKLNYYLFGYFDPIQKKIDSKNNNFRGELIDITVKTATHCQGVGCPIRGRHQCFFFNRNIA